MWSFECFFLDSVLVVWHSLTEMECKLNYVDSSWLDRSLFQPNTSSLQITYSLFSSYASHFSHVIFWCWGSEIWWLVEISTLYMLFCPFSPFFILVHMYLWDVYVCVCVCVCVYVVILFCCHGSNNSATCTLVTGHPGACVLETGHLGACVLVIIFLTTYATVQ